MDDICKQKCHNKRDKEKDKGIDKITDIQYNDFRNLCVFCNEILIITHMIYDMKVCEKCRINFKEYYEKYSSVPLYYCDPNFNIIKKNYINKYVKKIKN